MFFPLGLGLKLRNLPWVTYLIVLINCGIYFGIQDQKTVSNEVMDTIFTNSEKLLEQKEKIFLEYCMLYSEDLKDCKNEKLEGNKDSDSDSEIDLTPSQKLRFMRVKELTRKRKSQIYEDFYNDFKEENSKVTKLKTYATYSEIEKQNIENINQVHKKHNLLSKENISLKSVLWATFTHGSIMHLLGNMFVLFMFGKYVESTIGSFEYLFLYTIFGCLAIGIYAHGASEGMYVLGASANVFFAMGMFYVLFFHFKMKVYIWYFFIVSRKVVLNTKYYFPFLFLGQEIVLSFSVEKGVAHKAHLYGLILGLIVAFIWKKLNYMPKSFLYQDEYEKWTRVKKIKDIKKFLAYSNNILQYNPYNTEVKNEMLDRIIAHNTGETSGRISHKYLNTLLPYYLVDHIHDKQTYPIIYNTLEIIPQHVSYIQYFIFVNQKSILLFLDHSIDNHKLRHSVKLIQLYYEKYPRSRKLKNLEKTLFSILDNLFPTKELLVELDVFQEGSKSLKFTKAISRYKLRMEINYGQDQ